MARSASEASTAPCWRVSPERITRLSLAFRARLNSCVHLFAADLSGLIHQHDATD
jgi:hypothetical protein